MWFSLFYMQYQTTCWNVIILNPRSPMHTNQGPYSALLHNCMMCQEHRAYRTMWLLAWSGHSRLYHTLNMIWPLVSHSHRQLVLGLTVQLDLQSMVGCCCRLESPLALTLGPAVNTSGEGGPGYKAWERIRTTFVCQTIDKKVLALSYTSNLYLCIYS